ncbi:hypothetical protein CPB85DRAFT_1252533 [Mucidula mucida]|nr:hypothetical protein CPB85DRAFT_1252533 [Mucidula mucida]
MSRGQSYSHLSRNTAQDSECSISTLDDNSRRLKRFTSSSQTTHNLTRLVTLILHLLTVIIHIVLLGIWSKHVEHNITVPLGEATSRASAGVVVVLQGFGILFSTLMVMSVQSLSAKTILHKDVTITALHDTASAWSGLGSAARALSRQFSLPSAWWPVASALLYLGGIAVFHISTPSLLNLETFNATLLRLPRMDCLVMAWLTEI